MARKRRPPAVESPAVDDGVGLDIVDDETTGMDEAAGVLTGEASEADGEATAEYDNPPVDEQSAAEHPAGQPAAEQPKPPSPPIWASLRTRPDLAAVQGENAVAAIDAFCRQHGLTPSGMSESPLLSLEPPEQHELPEANEPPETNE